MFLLNHVGVKPTPQGKGLSEDPYLCGEFINAAAEGVQSAGVMPCVSEFIDIKESAGISERDYSARTIEEIYLAPIRRLPQSGISYCQPTKDLSDSAAEAIVETLQDKIGKSGYFIDNRIESLALGAILSEGDEARILDLYETGKDRTGGSEAIGEILSDTVLNEMADKVIDFAINCSVTDKKETETGSDELALRAAEEMAKAMDDKAFAKKCRKLFEQGSAWMDANLFNGEYYEHKITDPETFEFLDMDDPNVQIPAFQLGKGCLVDQLVGQYMAHICGLGYLGNEAHIRTTLQSIMKYNYVPDFSRHFNNMRSYVMGNEAGLLMASWPKGRLEVPFPYFAEVMTGFEYCAAVSMLYEGMEDEALTCIRAIRDRFDGAKRNPFSEPECGHHYARSMASWAAVLALSDFHYSGVEQQMSFTSQPGTYFWSNGSAWGLCTISASDATLKVLKGSLSLKKFQVGDKTIKLKNVNLKAGDEKTMEL